MVDFMILTNIASLKPQFFFQLHFCEFISKNIIYFFFLIYPWQQRPLGLLGLGWLVWSFKKKCRCGKVFKHYELGWSPIRVIVSVAVTYSQSRRVVDFSHCTKPSHIYFIFLVNKLYLVQTCYFYSFKIYYV